MANTVTLNGRFIHIVFDGATKWDVLADIVPLRPEAVGGIKVKSLHAKAAASDDVLTVRDILNAGTSGPVMFDNKFTSEYDTRDKDFGDGKICFPSIVGTEATSGVKLTIELA